MGERQDGRMLGCLIGLQSSVQCSFYRRWLMFDADDPGTSLAFLTLGAFAQTVAEQLAKGAEEAGVRDVVGEALKTLRAVKSNRLEDTRTTSGLRPFEDYEQVDTLNNVLQREESLSLDDLLRMLEKLAADGTSVSGSERDRLTKFFDDLAMEALLLAKQPPESVSSDVLELCRTA